jgi:glycine cleavage system regulatory protein
MDINPLCGNAQLPTCDQITRACRLYEAGGNSEEFRVSFAGELDETGLMLVWCSAIACFRVNERLFG